ncbi:MAG: glycosyl transferase family 2 [Bacteroidetes bacterium GWF2_41_31]|nr:MAG: glycosyl transferase family 2 [Bacteroidetes bacterium GWF2_41_31]
MYFKIINIAIKSNGGIVNTVVKLFKVVKEEGLIGIVERLFYIKESNKGGFRIIEGTYINDYTEWIKRYDTLTENDLEIIRIKQSEFVTKPLISIILPVYNAKPQWLIKAVESVINQTYPHWELCIADDASTDPEIRKVLLHYKDTELRIKVVFRKSNGHISACSNSALQMASGEWIALLDHDDLLPEHALYWVVKYINKHPNCKLLYSDEDKVDEDDKGSNPYFKCDWNQDLFYSQNLISHLGVYNAAIVNQIGGFKLGLEGSQDYDLALRFIERINRNEIVHIPKVLYHWRLHSESTARSIKSKSYALEAGIRAINEHFNRCGKEAKAEINEINNYRVKYQIPLPYPMVSLIIPTNNGLQLLRKCINSIISKTTYKNYEIIIIDNNSDDKRTLKYLEKIQIDPRIRCIRDEIPFNFSALYNRAIQYAKGEFIGMINNDTEVITPNWIEEMISLAASPGVGAVGAKLYFPNRTVQHSGIILGINGVANHPFTKTSQSYSGYFGRSRLIQEYSAVTAACLMVKKDIYLEVGGLDEINLAIAYNDVDFCLKVKKAGYRNVWTPYAELFHAESSTRGYEDTPEKLERLSEETNYMMNKWSEIIYNDPAYSPNLSLESTDFSLAWPPRIEKY